MNPATPARASSSEGGSAPLLLMGMCAVALAFAGILGASLYLHAAVRLHSLADQAALEAADTLTGRLPGDACSKVRTLVRQAASEVVECAVSGLESRIQLRLHVGAFVLNAKAHAGPSRNTANLTSP